MTTSNRIREKGFNAALILLLFLATGIYSCAHAQTLRPFKYMGFEGSFGVRSFRISSSIPELNQMSVIQGGGSLGLTFGNDLLRAKIRGAGFYFSESSVPRTVDLFESETIINFYPLQYIRQNKNALDIYLLAGVSMDNIKFYGHYLTVDKTKINYSTSSEPYLGKVSQINAAAGIGLEYQLPFEYDFVHLFGEAKYGTPISETTSDRFKSTSVKNFSSINLGVSFGLVR